MARAVICYTCNQKNYFHASWAGRVTTCQYCGQAVTVPADGAEVDIPAGAAVAPATPVSAEAAAFVHAAPPLSMWRIIGTLLCVVLGLVAMLVGSLMIFGVAGSAWLPLFFGSSAWDPSNVLVMTLMYALAALYLVCALGVCQRYAAATWIACASAGVQALVMVILLTVFMENLMDNQNALVTCIMAGAWLLLLTASAYTLLMAIKTEGGLPFAKPAAATT